MESWAIAFLGVIALSSVVQAGLLIGLALNGRRFARRLNEIQRRLDEEIRPSLQNLSRVSEDVAAISDMARNQARQFTGMLAEALITVEDTIHTVQRLVLRPLAPLADIAAFLKGVRRGIEVYRRLGDANRQQDGEIRRYVGDEHLFI